MQSRIKQRGEPFDRSPYDLGSFKANMEQVRDRTEGYTRFSSEAPAATSVTSFGFSTLACTILQFVVSVAF